jgi:cell division transport system ATP-binding protein
MTLIGKLDYPEITAFDYELEHLPELKPEDQEVATEENADIPEIQEELPEKKRKKNLPPALDVELID